MVNEEIQEPLTSKVRAKSKPRSTARKKSSAGARAGKSAPRKSASKKVAGKKKAGRTKQSLRKVAEQVKEALPDIVDKLVEKAKSGSVQHAKMLLTSTGADKLLEQQCMATEQEDESLASLLLRRLDDSDTDQARQEMEAEITESKKQRSTMAAEEELEES